MLFLVGITFTFFLAFLLAGKKNKSRADKILATWLFFVGLHLSFFYFSITKLNFRYPFLLGIEIPMPLLHGPFLFLYVSTITDLRNKWQWKLVLHFIPFAAALLSLAVFFLLPGTRKIAVYEAQGKPYEVFKGVLLVGFVVSGATYTILSLLKLLEHRRRINDYFSFTEKINLKWLLYLISGLSIIWMIVIAGDEELTFSAVVIYVFWIGYFGIKQVGIFTQREISAESNETPPLPSGAVTVSPFAAGAEPDTGVPPMPAENETETTKSLEGYEENPGQAEKIKYEKSGLTDTGLRVIHAGLTELMQKEKLYTNPELTLADLSKILQVHPNIVSQVINTIEQNNFYDYINKQRISEFLRISALPENKNFTLLSLAFECGFNSKTSFNRNFKKVTGLSPTEYLKKENTSLDQ
ncbi:MAG: helix-turn-helix transcriptional regulator [Chitinophagaceae bacterium]|nr:helix-turn-helix transcriptional regulator [Chitinophagaceae bacterium]